MLITTNLFAQGTENALEALFQFTMIAGSWVLLAAILLILVAVKKEKRNFAIAAYVVAAITFIIAIFARIQFKHNDYYSNDWLTELYSNIVFGSLVYAGLIYLLSNLKKKETDETISVVETNNSLSNTIKIISVLIIFSIIQGFYSELNLFFTMQYNIGQSLPLLFLISRLIPLLLQVVLLYCFQKRLRIGWMLLIFIFIWGIVNIVIGYSTFIINTYSKPNFSLGISFVISMVFMGIYTWVLFRSLKKQFFEIFSILPTERNKILFICLGLAIAFVLLQMYGFKYI